MAYNAKLRLDIFRKRYPFPSLNIGGRDWCCWKQHFLSFLEREDPNGLHKDQWAHHLLKLIEPYGEEAYENLLSVDARQKMDLEILLCDLDVCFIFKFRQKQADETIDIYIDSLMLAAIASNHSDPVNIVKHKIVQDISCNLVDKASIFIDRSKEENLESYLKSMDLHKIILFWKQRESLTSQRDIMGCVRCGTTHSKNHCPAHKVQCGKCKRYNHFTEYCKVEYVSDCTKCGEGHIQSRCPAFGKLCTKCGRTNHLAQLCQVPIVKNCQRCGKDHAVTACSAQGKLCLRCKKPNHLQEKCMSKIEKENY